MWAWAQRGLETEIREMEEKEEKIQEDIIALPKTGPGKQPRGEILLGKEDFRR